MLGERCSPTAILQGPTRKTCSMLRPSWDSPCPWQAQKANHRPFWPAETEDVLCPSTAAAPCELAVL